MVYQSLYRRRRPLTFSDMTGQEHITRTLSNALSRGKLAHAYLFCGPRGTGKTTAAKILSRAMNCVNYPAPEPCGQCSSCQNIAAGVSIDVIEMDAASNRGIDEIRDLREKSRYASGESRYKVYIIDEAHMLTTEACNAFLKTLEEPPPEVVFVLATTDPSRLPSTIVSRCQRFDFHLLTIEEIRDRLTLIMAEEGWESDEEAPWLIARLADGSMRDALGVLEQCSAYSEGSITAEQVRLITGATRVETIEAMVVALANNDLDTIFAVLTELIQGGRDLDLLMRDLTFIFSRLLLRGGGEKAGRSDQLHGFETLVQNNHGLIERKLLFEAVELLHQAGSELRRAHFKQYVLEITFIRLLRLLHGRLPEHVSPPEERASAPGLEPKRDESPGSAPEAGKEPEKAGEEPAQLKRQTDITGREVTPGVADAPAEKHPADKFNADSAQERLVMLAESWPMIVRELKQKQKSTAAWLEPAQPGECRGNIIQLNYTREYTIHHQRIMGDHHRPLVEEVLSKFCGVPVNIRAKVVEGVPDRDSAGAQGGAEVENVPARERLTRGTAERQRERPAGDDLSEMPVEEGQNKPAEAVQDSKKRTSAEEAQLIFGGKLIEHP